MDSSVKNSVICFRKLIPIYIFAIFTFQPFIHSVYGQSNPDSLQRVIKTAKHDTVRYNAFYDLGSLFLNNNPDTAIILFKKAQSTAKKISGADGELRQAKALYRIGRAYTLKSEYEQSIQLFHEALGFVEKHLKNPDSKLQRRANALQAGIYGNIGSTYSDQSQYALALEFNFKALKLYDKIEDKKGAATIIGNIGLVYSEQSDYSKALEYYLKALKINEELNYKVGQAINLANIGSIYGYEKNYDRALACYKKSLTISEEINNLYGQNVNLANIGGIYYLQEKHELAIEYYQKAQEINMSIGNQNGVAYSYSNIGKSYSRLGQFQKAEELLKQAEKMDRELKVLFNLEGTCKALSELYEKTGRHKLALDYYKEFVLLRDSIQGERNVKEGLQKEMQYQYERQVAIDSIADQKEIKIREAEIDKRDAEIKAKKNQQYALFGGLALVIVFGVFMFNRYRITKKQKHIIEEQKEVVEMAHKEITDSIHYAKRIQSAIIPSEKMVKDYFPESFVLYKPKDVVAGDFYWMENKENKILIAACDCTGHGVPGAMVSVVCNNGLNRSVKEFGLTDPGRILDKTREIVIAEFEKSEEEVKDGMDVSLCVLDGKSLYYAGANNPLWIIRKGGEEIEEIRVDLSAGTSTTVSTDGKWHLIEVKADKQHIGKTENPYSFTTNKIMLNSGDNFYIFTDGFQDQFGGQKGKKFKTSQLKELLLSIQNESMTRQKEIIFQKFDSWKGNLEQVDDVCIIGIRV